MTKHPKHEDNALEDHDRGLQHDLTMLTRRVLERRSTLAWLTSAGAVALLAGCGGDSGSDSSSSSTTTTTTTTTGTTTTGTTTTGTTTTGTTTTSSCTVYATETNGPYPADGSNTANGSVVNAMIQSGIVRTDMRSSFGSSTTTASGVKLTLTIKLTNTNNNCAALSGYAIYVWHCDAVGRYSLYDLPTENYLRAVGVTDANGEVTFTSIFPGCYDGRYPHIHFEVYPSVATATTYLNRLLTSQFAMAAAACTAVYSGASSTYTNSTANYNRVSIASDNVFGDNTAAQIAAMTLTMSGDVTNGYTGSAVVGLAR
jgi:protocatechuate 3,4-dioxygenase beta subunit